MSAISKTISSRMGSHLLDFNVIILKIKGEFYFVELGPNLMIRS